MPKLSAEQLDNVIHNFVDVAPSVGYESREEMVSQVCHCLASCVCYHKHGHPEQSLEEYTDAHLDDIHQYAMVNLELLIETAEKLLHGKSHQQVLH